MTFPELFRTDVRIERDIAYLDDGHERHRLDIYAPPGAAGLPVVLYFHGGGWYSGDKRLFEHLGRAFAVRGCVAVVVNYRLTPEVMGPEHARDAAAALQWVYNNIERYGGSRERLVLSGHSAGGHLATLIALDPRYRAEFPIPNEALRGVAMISAATDLRIHAETTRFTPREKIEEAFGSTQEMLGAASPIEYVHAGAPPFLILVAEDDPPGLREQGRRLADALREEGNTVHYASIKGRDHYSIVRRFGPSDDPTVGAIIDFVNHYAAPAAPQQ